MLLYRIAGDPVSAATDPYERRRALRVIRGDTIKLSYLLVQDDPAVPAVLTGSQILFTVRADRDDTDDVAALAQVTLGSGIAIVDEPTGEIEVEVPPSLSQLMLADSYWYDLQYTAPGEQTVTTLRWGTMKVVPDATKTLPV